MYHNIGPGNFYGLGINFAGFANDYYWSSSERGDNTAWGLHFGNNAWDPNAFRQYEKHVRAIRAF